MLNWVKCLGIHIWMFFRMAFHHKTFRGKQREVVTYLTSNNDILAVIPTGGGKSICYWTAGLVSSGVTVVITPLIALMNDQVSK